MWSTTSFVTSTPLALAAAWRVLDSGAADGATNMAIDVALMAHARATGEATLRIYAWSRPTLSFGRHERTRGRFDAARLRAAGVDVVRRPTGGRALLHHREVTYSVTARVDDAQALRERSDAINGRLLRALDRLGVAAAPWARRLQTPSPGTSACFAEPNRGEIVVDGRKLIASAQFVEDGAFVQHGSILLHDDQSRIAELCSVSEAPTTAVALSPLLRRDVGYDEVRSAVVREFFGGTEISPTRVPNVAADEDFFRNDEWTWRR
jgi:lipoate-protein ligase A